MKKKHWIEFLDDSRAIRHIFKEDKIIPNLDLIVVEDIRIGFNLNSIKFNFNFNLPKNPPKKFKLKDYNITGGDLDFSNISKLRIEKEMIYDKEEVYSFTFEEISHNKILVQIKGSLGSKFVFISEFICLLNFGGRCIWLENEIK